MGASLDDYQIVCQIGEGGGGIVYKAYHRNLRKYVVLKKMREEAKGIFGTRVEIDILKNLKSPYLPQVYDFLTLEDGTYTVMEFIPGNSFKELLTQGQRFSETDVLAWAKQICSTLMYLHGQDPPIIHSDIKPSNIMLKPDREICLIDFNVSAAIGEGAMVNGYTETYASPEQIWVVQYNHRQSDPEKMMFIDERSDIYSFGASIYHILSGQKPEKLSAGKFKNIRELIPGMNRSFAGIIMKCMEEDPGNRFQSSGELYEALCQIGTHSSWWKYLLTGSLSLAALLGGLTYARIKSSETQERYDYYTAQEWEAITEGEYDRAERMFQEAVALAPARPDAYYNKMLSLNAQCLYKENIDFINSFLNLNGLHMDQFMLDDIYYMQANCYEKIQEYDSAVESYSLAIGADNSNPDYYRDYAVALSEAGKLEEAEDALEVAREKGVDSVSLSFIQGQIKYRSGKTDEAKGLFLDCIEKTENHYVKKRAYLMLADCLEASDGELLDVYAEETGYLEEAKENLPLEYRSEVMQRLADCYIRQYELTRDNWYYDQAGLVYTQMWEDGSASYEDSRNLARIYMNRSQFDKAKEVLLELLEQYGEKYVTYRELASNEMFRQAEMKQVSRDYNDFCEYYLKAARLYEIQNEQDTVDEEMGMLKEKYESLASI